MHKSMTSACGGKFQCIGKGCDLQKLIYMMIVQLPLGSAAFAMPSSFDQPVIPISIRILNEHLHGSNDDHAPWSKKGSSPNSAFDQGQVVQD